MFGVHIGSIPWSEIEAAMREVRVKKTKTVCTYCAVGCTFDVWTKDRHILKVEPSEGAANGTLVGITAVLVQMAFDHSARSQLWLSLLSWAVVLAIYAVARARSRTAAARRSG